LECFLISPAWLSSMSTMNENIMFFCIKVACTPVHALEGLKEEY
jgi:hypothetical protein